MDERPPGRYRGRRRVPSVPPGRYAAVITSAVLGAGVVALGASAAVPDAKQDPSQLSALGGLDTTQLDRSDTAERASRAERERGGLATSIVQEAPDVYLLPLTDYQVSSAFGYRWGAIHNGVDLAAPTGTTIRAVRAGTVTFSDWNGGYGYLVVVEHDDGVETYYAHASQLLASVGQEVEAGEPIALVGNTGNSFGSHLHFEVHVDGVPTEPVAWLNERGVDINTKVEEIYGSAA